MPRSDELHDELQADRDSFALIVRSDDGERAARALAAVEREILTMPAGIGATTPRTSPIVPLPGGVAIRIDDLSTRVDTRRRTADVVRDALTDLDLDPSAVTVSAVDGLRDLDRTRRAVVLRVFPTPSTNGERSGSGQSLDPTWIDVASEWVFGDQPPEARVRMRVLGIEIRVAVADAPGVLHGCAVARAWCDVVTGDMADRVRTASVSFGWSPHVAIAAGGPACDDAGLLARFDLLAEVARELAPAAAYACLDFESNFSELGTGLAHSDWSTEGGAPANRVLGTVGDRFVPDAFPLQVLGPGHLDQLGDGASRIPARLWSADLPDGRRELHVAEPVDWLWSSPVRADVRGDGWDLLEPVLLDRTRFDGLVTEVAPTAGEAPAPTVGQHGLPPLDALTIDTSLHPRRGTRLTVLELTAWLAGDHHGDDPPSVSPVLKRYVRTLAHGLDDERRQSLRHLAGALAGTGPGDDDGERRRAWLLTDWLVRSHAPPWLRRAGLTESAERLTTLGSISDTSDLVRAVDLLGSAIVTASRRLEITESIAGEDRAHLIDEIAWEVWEDAAERTGWVAASDAISYRIPPDLAYAADQRVVECSRDPRVRAELDDTAHGLGDAIWSAALQEIASAAWASAWAAAEAFVRHETTFSLRTAINRSLEAELGGGDTVAVELVLDDIDRAARDELARQVLADDERVDYWKLAVDAAPGTARGGAWRTALDTARHALGDGLFDESIDVADAELRSWLGRAPGLVGRAVAGAVAREASGVAGRGMAARAAAEALARGASVDAAAQAAEQAVADIVEDLADGAVTMIERLVAFEPF